jgi:hypothetical protein
MTDSEYRGTLFAAVRKLRDLMKQQEETALEISKLRQFIHATANMLPDDERSSIQLRLSLADLDEGLKRAGLHDAIRQVLEQHPKEFLTVTRVRDELRGRFDFSNYKSNPLASVATTLRRFKPTLVETKEIDGVAAYRWKNTKANRQRKVERAQLDALFKEAEAAGWKPDEPEASQK